MVVSMPVASMEDNVQIVLMYIVYIWQHAFVTYFAVRNHATLKVHTMPPFLTQPNDTVSPQSLEISPTIYATQNRLMQQTN